MKTVYHWLSICFNHSLRVFWYQEAAASATDAGIHKKNVMVMQLGMSFGHSTTNNVTDIKWLNGIYENSYIFWSSGLLVKDFTQTIETETKEQKGGFLDMLLGSLAVIILEIMSASKD